MKKSRISKYFLIVSVFTFLAIFVYLVSQSYNNLMKPIEEVKNNTILKPINPNLDVSVIDLIEKRNPDTQ